MTLLGDPRSAIAFERAHASSVNGVGERTVRNTDTTLKSLYDDYYARLLSYVNRILSDPHLAEDVVQETMLRAWQHADTLTPERGSVWGWLTRVAHNIAIDRIRARRARPTEVDETAGSSSADYDADHADAVVNRVVVATMVSKLVPAHRSVLYEVYFADHTAASAASTLGIPPGTVKSRLHHALRNLKTTMDPRSRDPFRSRS
ncbi:RNA polymerase sigma-70 factor (ECF subfamily) [Saccharopolyspora dendranthemae]|uniref:RNA polymerase sigma-70 factor (ECF subfamily) n=1 Tax=Saccharopolyspora dendranthemae TaxID=1181886 RepID=A0A561VA90_9PSEU|nr:RNA polymerase sigma-70 factor (ECF subfamily) [Saccharopolyspora dendranthemae]